MGSKGGGGVDTSGLEEATKQATALQERIYNQTYEDYQPYYEFGTGAVSALSDLLGIGGGSVKNREQIYSDLLPQYTTQNTTSSGDSSLYVAPDGSVVDLSDLGQYKNRYSNTSTLDIHKDQLSMAGNLYNQGNYEGLSSIGWNALNPSTTTDVTDYDALNAAVESQLSGQTLPDNYGSLLEKFDETKMQDSAGYQFRVDEANKALERQMAAQGVTLGGGGAGDINPQSYRAMQELNQGLASQEYQNEYARYTSDQLNTFNMLMGATGVGQQVTGQIAQSGANYADNVGNLTTGLASAQLNADLSSAASGSSMFSSVLGSISPIYSAISGQGNAATTAASILASDIRLKEDIKLVGVENGHNLYEFKYIDGDDRKYIGVMAHEAKESNPDAVIEMDNGYLAVDYGKLGLAMREA